MNTIIKNILAISLIGITLSACKKEDPIEQSSTIDPNRKGNLTLEFDNRVGNLNLILDSPFYSNSFGQTFSISKFNYFISNIVLINENGERYTIPQDSSYFLIRENISSSRDINLKGIPEGNYAGIEFVIGVDSMRSTMTMDKRTGCLDPGAEASDMYWTWNSGYIFLKMEGKYDDPTDTISTTSNYFYHIGGFGNLNSPAINNIKKITLSFAEAGKAEVRAEHGTEGPKVHLYVDALKVLNGPSNVDFKVYPGVMLAPFSVNIANNYSYMFSVDHVHNHEH